MKVVPVTTIAKLVREKQMMLLPAPKRLEVGNDRVKSINRITHWFWAMPGCNRRQCIYVEKAQSACPWARPLLRDIYHLLSSPNHHRRSWVLWMMKIRYQKRCYSLLRK